MIFRRIKAHVSKEDWFAVFIDFCIVVLGVFMGFQVQQWNQDRSDRASGRQYLEGLVTDMRLSVDRNEYQADLGLKFIQRYDLILDALDTCQLEQEQKPTFATGLYNLGKIDMPIMVMGTIDQLNATGSFPLIGDLALRRKIAESVRHQDTVSDINSQITGRVIPSVNYVRSFVRFNLEEHIISQSEIDQKFVKYDFDQLCADQKFINAIANVREMTLANIMINQDRGIDQAALITTLQQALATQPGDSGNN